MHVAHVAPVIYPVPPKTYGGTERVVADLATAQAKAGHEVTVFAPCDSRLTDVEIVGSYRSASASSDTYGKLTPGFPAELEAEQLADLVTRAAQFDVVHLHGSAHRSFRGCRGRWGHACHGGRRGLDRRLGGRIQAGL